MGNIPDELKIAKVVPIHKKGDVNKFSNYRPVSVLPAFSKIIEKLVYTHIKYFLDKHNILYAYQFGFRKNMSTSMALNTLVHKFHDAINNDNFMIGIFLDLSRAFDTITHDILLSKLDYYGIRGIALEWFKNYLTSRKQFVSYNNQHSLMGDRTVGIPQGCILGPLLF